MIRIKRVYEDASAEDGYRVLVERLWPRGIKKEALPLDEWCKDIAPSTELRKWFGHDPGKWKEFQKRYRAELRRQPAAAAVAGLVKRSSVKTVTLLVAAKDEQHNSAVVLREQLEAALSD